MAANLTNKEMTAAQVGVHSLPFTRDCQSVRPTLVWLAAAQSSRGARALYNHSVLLGAICDDDGGG